jgi:hypothetical protein
MLIMLNVAQYSNQLLLYSLLITYRTQQPVVLTRAWRSCALQSIIACFSYVLINLCIY